MFCPLTTTGPGETVFQTDESMFVADCKVNHVALVGHVKMTLVSERVMPICGVPNERLNTVPKPKLPPMRAVPYRVLPDKIKLAYGLAPSLLVRRTPEHPVKLYRFVKAVPLVLILNTVPLFAPPPKLAVPYKVLSDKINPAYGEVPSMTVKLCRFVKPVPSVLMANTVPAPKLPPPYAVPYRVFPDKINPANVLAPPLPVKLYRFVKPAPSVLTANTVPLPELPPLYAVP